MAAGQVRIELPRSLDATVYANVRMGQIDVDGREIVVSPGGRTRHFAGYDVEHTVLPPAGATGAPVTITVHLADGNIAINRY